MAHSPDSAAKSPYTEEKRDAVQHDSEKALSAPVHVDGELRKDLKSRHMQMIAIGGAIGAGLFVGAGGALATGGPGSLITGFIIVGIMLLFTVQALGELAVLYPVNGAFFTYICRFIDESWGFAIGWDYAISWLIILPFEITAACVTLQFWEGGRNVNQAVWVTVFLFVLCAIQLFGVKGFGEVEFALALVKIAACTGFIILGIIINCGGVPTDTRGYIGAAYWHNPGAFLNGFKGFCSVFVTAAFSFAGTELAGLCAAEAANPRKSIPQATKQVFWRISFFYIVNLFVLGLVIRADTPALTSGTSGADTRASPFVLAIQQAGIKALPSIFNVVICLAVVSVANTCTYGSTRTIQALATRGMAPGFFAKIDKKGRPVWCIALQILFGFLAYINAAKNGSQVFHWLLALSGVVCFVVWGSICIAHIRFRMAWRQQGRSLDIIPYKAPFGIWGSYFGAVLNLLALLAQLYIAASPVGKQATAYSFFQAYLAAPLIIILYVVWKFVSRQWRLYIPISSIDLDTGLRDDLDQLLEYDPDLAVKTWGNLPKRLARGLF